MQLFFRAVVAFTLLVASTVATAHNSKPGGIQVERLLQADSAWDGTPYKAYPTGTPKLSLLKITIPPNTVLPWHVHPIPNAAYMISGTLVVEKKADGKKRMLKAGEVLAEMVDDVHRGYTEKDGATLIVFYAGTEATPLSSLVKP